MRRLLALTGLLLAAGACSGDDPVEPTPTPSITLIAPNSGPALGGGTVTIAGSGFTGTPTVTFGNTAATGVTVSGGVSITATVPTGAPGAVTVTVANADGKSGSLANGYTYIGAPSVTGVTPASGTTAGGNTVTITGTGFVAVPTVTFGGTAATNVAFVSSTSVTAVVPAHAAGAVAVVVRNADGQTGTANTGYTYVAAPTITSATPNQGPVAGGTAVTLAGTGFVNGATVTVGGTAATAVTVAAGGASLTFTTPARPAGPANIVVTNPDGQSVTLANGFTYNASPTVTGVTPNGSTLAGGVVVITGTGFAGTPSVTFGGTAATNVVVASSTQMSVTAPAHAVGAVTVVVTNADGQSGSLANAFTYRAPPTVTSVTPSSGPAIGGTAVTVNGTGFVAGATVTIGGTAATAPNVGGGGTTITFNTPAHAAGAVAVVVTNPDGQFGQSAVGVFTYVTSPTIAGVTPNTGSAAGGSVVVINGTGFTGTPSVTFGGTAATNVAVNNVGTQITVTTPAHVNGDVLVAVTNADGQSTSLANAFTYITPPTITTVTPAEGAPTGGLQVVINGTDFEAGATVSFGGVAGTAANVESSTQIRVTTPAHALGAVTVTVTNPNGISGSKANAFAYVAPATLAKSHWLVDLTWTGGTFQFDTDIFQQANPAIISGTSTFTSGSVTYTVTIGGNSRIVASRITVTFSFIEGAISRGSVTCVADILGTGAQQHMTGTYSATDVVPGAVGNTTGTCEIH